MASTRVANLRQRAHDPPITNRRDSWPTSRPCVRSHGADRPEQSRESLISRRDRRDHDLPDDLPDAIARTRGRFPVLARIGVKLGENHGKPERRFERGFSHRDRLAVTRRRSGRCGDLHYLLNSNMELITITKREGKRENGHGIRAHTRDAARRGATRCDTTRTHARHARRGAAAMHPRTIT